jgi:uncharacterized membrane protein YfcA
LLDQLDLFKCTLLVIAAFGIGFSKSGFQGVGMIHVVIFAFIFGARDATGVLLPLLIVGDVCAIGYFGKQAQWHHIRRLLPPTAVGVIVGWLLMRQLPETAFKPLVGSIILGLIGIQIMRMSRPNLFEKIPHQKWFASSLGILVGITTMLANSAGPVMALYLLAVSLPKWELVGTTAWFFLVINVFKVPFSYNMGLINFETLAINAIFAPAVLPGMWLGRWLIQRISQRVFDSLLLALTGIFALRLIGLI